MKRLVLIGLFFSLAMGVSAQTMLVPSVSNFHLTWSIINPAFTGFRDALSINSLYRSPMYGQVGPSNMQLNVHTPLGTSNTAVGAVVAFNTTPVTNMYSFTGTYAYRVRLNQAKLSFGLSAGMYALNQDRTQLSLRDPSDQSFESDVYTRFFPNFGTGILYYRGDFFVGLSVPELLSVPLEGEGVGKFRFDEYDYILTTAYQFNFSDAFRLKPAALINYNTEYTYFKLSLTAGLMDSRLYIGGVYDYPQNVIALVNFQVNPQWLVGYAYTMNTGPVRTALGGSHEVVLRWEFRPVIRTIDDDPFYF